MPVVEVKKNGVWEEVAGVSGHTHTKDEIISFPTSLPANGGNADTLDGKHANEFAGAYNKLWANASPRSSFAAQTISVNGVGYDQYCIVFCRSTTTYFYSSVTFPVSGGSTMSLYFGDANYGTHRDVTGSDEYSIVFGGATLNGQKNQNNNLIPYAIYGIKGGV